MVKYSLTPKETSIIAFPSTEIMKELILSRLAALAYTLSQKSNTRRVNCPCYYF